MSQSKTATKALPAKRSQPDEDVPEWARPDKAGLETVELPEGEPTEDSNEDQGATPVEVVEGVVQGLSAGGTPALDNLLEWLAKNCTGTDESDLSGLEAIVREALSADDMAAVFREKLPSGAQQWIDAPLLLTGFTIRESDYEDSKSLPYYMSLEVTCGDPAEARVINTGSIKIMAQVKRLSEIGTWPIFCQIVEAAKAKKGQDAPLKLAMLDR